MERIVDGILFEGKRVANCFDVKTWSANGVMERSIRPVMEWTELGPAPGPLFDLFGNLMEPTPASDAELEEKRQRKLQQSAMRAKTMCRRVIITEGFDELLTLTYRENQTDRDLCKAHFKEWYRRMKRALKTFRFCASFEVQQRGAMHIHIATHKLPEHAHYKGVKIKAWQLGTRIWRDIVGADNGLCFVGGKSKFGKGRRKNMSLAKMASYVSKYIMKDYENAPEQSNRYSRSNGTVVGEVHTMRLNGSLLDLMVVTFECGEGDVIVSHRVGRFGDSAWLCTEAVT
ncbi:MAG: hypothetical protein EPN61_12015 [Burkholderiaceae bacterium]|nr:MAG: hypothetical protein EPN61_12015 [Burkholderiaceae bacterium]